MEINAYSLCPGGTGKKIKFCCPECIPHLEKLTRMAEGEQYKAALAALESAERALPDKPCLLHAKIRLLDRVNAWEESDRVKQVFFEKHPDNPVALAQAVGLTEDVDEAFDRFEKAWAACRRQETVYPELLEALEDIADILEQNGAECGALHFLRVAAGLDEGRNEVIADRVWEFNSRLPLILRIPMEFCPVGAGTPWEDRKEEVRRLLLDFQISASLKQLAALAEEFPREPSIRYDLAILRLLRGDNEGASVELRQYAEMEGVPFEDATEAYAFSAALTDDPLGDKLPIMRVDYPIFDFDRVIEAFLAEPRAVVDSEFSPTKQDYVDVPPKAVIALLDKPAFKKGEKPTADTLPSLIGTALLYGRQTDREARLELRIIDPVRCEGLESWLGEIEGIGEPVPDSKNTDPIISQTACLLFPAESYSPRIPAHLVEEIEDERRCAEFTDAWCAMPLGILDGKTPDEAAKDPSYRIRLGAAVLLIEDQMDRFRSSLDFNRIRARLRLPPQGHLEVEGIDALESPVTRWHRIRTEKLPDKKLLTLFTEASIILAERAMITAGEAILNRPSLSKEPLVPMVLFEFTRLFNGTSKALKYCERGRELAAAAGKSTVLWDIREYELRMGRFEADEARAALERIIDKRDDPVAERFLSRLMEQLQIRAEADRQARQRAGEPPVESQETRTEIWTPDSEAAGASKGKIWMPGMD